MRETLFGALNRPLKSVPKDLEVLAVRGPRTRDILGDSAISIFGDPAIVLPTLITKPKNSGKICVIPHYVDYVQIRSELPEDNSIKLLDVSKANFAKNVLEIAAADLVISSSLHGLIIAEAYGVPAIWLKVSDQIIGGRFKFDDYYEGTNRENNFIDLAEGFPKVLKMPPPSIPAFDPSSLTNVLLTKYRNYED